MIRRWTAGAALWLLAACGPAPVQIPAPPVLPADPAPEASADDPSASGGAGGASSDEATGREAMTGLASIDRTQDIEARILDARGSARVSGQALAQGQPAPLPVGSWLLTDAAAEVELTLKGPTLGDGIVRLAGTSAFLVERLADRDTPRLRQFGGKASFYLPSVVPGAVVEVLTPAGPLSTRGGVFTVAVSADSQVLVTCREGSVFLEGRTASAAFPGQVFIADRLGRGRIYTMTPAEAAVFVDHWLEIANLQAPAAVKALLPRQVAAWRSVDFSEDPEQARALALWFRQAQAAAPGVPTADTWNSVLAVPVRNALWQPPLEGPSLIGDLAGERP